MKSPIVIAIDGPSKSGKGTCAIELAKSYGFQHVDTGSMYRLLTWHCLKQRVDVANEKEVIDACHSWKAELLARDHEIVLALDGEAHTKAIRSHDVTDHVARVSPIPAVRIWMVRKQRECLRFGDLVMDGRDIGTVVFPETPFKFFLTADEELREARSRGKGELANMKERDKRDSARKSSPLVAAQGAVIIDNTHDRPAATIAFMQAHIDYKRQLLGL